MHSKALRDAWNGRRDLHPRPARRPSKASRNIGCFPLLASTTQQHVACHRPSTSHGDAIVRLRVGSPFGVSRGDLRGATSCPCSGLDLGASFSNWGRILHASVRDTDAFLSSARLLRRACLDCVFFVFRFQWRTDRDPVRGFRPILLVSRSWWPYHNDGSSYGPIPGAHFTGSPESLGRTEPRTDPNVDYETHYPIE